MNATLDAQAALDTPVAPMTPASASPAAPVVQLDGLHLHYGVRRVLDGLSWQLPRGAVVGLLGRNAVGKTTLLETLLGLRSPGSGRCQLFGQDATALDDSARARIGYVPQHSNLFEWMTPAQLLAYFRSFYPRWNEPLVQGLLVQWQINPGTLINRLSAGQQQRLSIIRALAHEPELLVLDEPVASLDPAGRKDFLRELVAQVIAQGTTVVFSTHILSDLERVAFDVAFMARGSIVLQAPLDELMETTRRVTGPQATLWPSLKAQGWQRLRYTALPGGQSRLLLRHADPGTVAATPGLEPVTLEDLFQELTL